MGWNNWNLDAGAGSNATNALATANSFVNLGLSQLGYKYISIDDCWSQKSRDSAGNLQPDPSKWPNGIKAVADQIHGMGLKFGLYGDSGTMTCAGYPGSWGYEMQDAKQLAAWGVDYWKYDNCNTPSTGTSQTRYTTMRDALASSGRTIFYAMCNWGQNSVWTWGASVGNSWRVSGDITDTWSSVASIAASNAGIASYAGPHGFNDFDMLEVGNGGLTIAEERAHFGLWAISKSPLILGTDLMKISSASLAIIKNSEVIAINQDPLGLAASPFRPSGQPAPSGKSLYPYYSGKLSDGYVVAMIAVNGTATLSVKFSDVPGLGAGTYAWREAYTGHSGRGSSISASLRKHDMAIFKVTKTSSSSNGNDGIVNSTTTTKHGSSCTTSATSTATTAANPESAPRWRQCGGIGWTGPTGCISPYMCKVSNPYYSQCL